MLLIYGSLYPWQFVGRELTESPLYILFHSFEFGTGRRFISDIIINIAIYVPLGMSGFLAFGKIGSRALRFVLPVMLGAALSGCIEMTQIFTPTRHCSTDDFLNNTLGSALGVIAGFIFEKAAGPILPGLAGYRAADPSAVALLFCQAASLVFPFFPVMALPEWRHKFSLFADASAFSPIPLISAAAVWIAIGFMIRATRIPHARLWLVLSLLLVPAQFAIATRQPLPADLIGAAAGIALFLLADRIHSGISIAAGAFIGVLILRGLAPFHWAAQAQAFTWVPFDGFLNTEWQYGIQLILQKTFYYGAAIWMLRRAALHWLPAICIVCAVLAAIEAVQTHLPGRTAEITDPLLALLAGLGLGVLERPAGMVGYHANS